MSDREGKSPGGNAGTAAAMAKEPEPTFGKRVDKFLRSHNLTRKINTAVVASIRGVVLLFNEHQKNMYLVFDGSNCVVSSSSLMRYSRDGDLMVAAVSKNGKTPAEQLAAILRTNFRTPTHDAIITVSTRTVPIAQLE